MPELTDNHKLLLAIGLGRGERIGELTDQKIRYSNAILFSEDAEQLYASEEAGRSALITLRFKGYIDITEFPGKFTVLNAPLECHTRGDAMRAKRHEKEKIQDISLS